MFRLILLVFIVAITGCEQTADSSGATLANAKNTPGSDKALAGPSAPPKAHVFQFGLYKATRKGMVKDSPGSNTGKVIRKPVLEHLKTTDHVPMVKDTYFGYQYRLYNLPPEALIKPFVKLRKVLIHPEMTLPDGSKATGWDRSFNARVNSQQILGFDGYAFNEDYELVAGDWIFQIWYKDKKLIERKFISVPPAKTE